MSNWWHPRDPEKVEPMPWLHPAVIAYLDSLLQPEWSVLEHGSGGSTLWLASRVKYVMAFESKVNWFNEMIRRTPANVAMVFGEGGPPEVAYELVPFDLLIIDGEPMPTRIPWMEAASALVKPGGIVVLDNANRLEYEEARKKLKNAAAHRIWFDMNPPGCRYCTTDFYRMKGGEVNFI